MIFSWYKRFKSVTQINGNILRSFSLETYISHFHISIKLNGKTDVDTETSIKYSIGKKYLSILLVT